MTGSSPTEFSVPDHEAISRRVALKWGWKGARCELWHRGTNDTYKIEKKGGRAFLKIYRRGWRSRAEIQGEVDLLNFLRRRSISVARPIRNRSGNFIGQVEAPEGRRYAVLFADAAGVQPEFDLASCGEYGAVAGTVHQATNACPGAIRRPQLGMEHLVHGPLRRAAPYLARRPRDLDYLKDVAGELADAVVSLLPATAPEFGMCHGDLTFGNLRRDDRGRYTLIDFDNSGFGWRSYDVSVFLWARGFDFSGGARANRAKKWEAFMDGYHRFRRLSKAELQAVNLFVPLRQVWQLGEQSRRWADTGRRAADDANLDMHLDFIRTWLRVYRPI